MSITYAVNSCLVKTPPIVSIDGKNYPTVKIDNLYWMASPLNSEKTGLNYNTDSYGLKRYKISSVISSIVPDLPNGWRVPSSTDLMALFNHLKNGNLNQGRFSLLSTGLPWYNLGTNETGLNLLPDWDEAETYRNVYCQDSSDYLTPGLCIYTDGTTEAYNNMQSYAYDAFYLYVRFCRDA